MLAGHGCHKSGAQRHLGFAKAHIAADQSVHRLGADHVVNHCVNGCALVGCFFKSEVLCELFVVLLVEAEGMALACGAAGVDVEQLGRCIAHLLGGFALGFFPLATAQTVQGGRFRRHARVAADVVQLADGHIQHGIFGVLQVQELLHGGCAIVVFLADIHIDQAVIAPNAVLAVHHRVTDFQLGQVFDQRLYIADLFLLLTPACGASAGEQLGFGDKVDAFFHPRKTAHEGGGGNAQFFAGFTLELGQRIKGRWVQLRRAQKVQQAFTAAITFGQHQHAALGRLYVLLQALQWVFCPAHDGQVWQLLEDGAVLHIVYTGAQRQLLVRLGSRVELLGTQKQGVGGQDGALGIALHQAVAVLGVLPETVKSRLQLTMQHQRGGIAQVVKHRGSAVKEQGQVVLNTGSGYARAHVLVDAAACGVALQQFTPA